MFRTRSVDTSHHNNLSLQIKIIYNLSSHHNISRDSPVVLSWCFTSSWRIIQTNRLYHLVRIPAGAEILSPRHRVQTDSGPHSAFYLMGIRGFFPGGKAAAAWI